ncbi:MAG: SRPBCC domain-containing protein [Bacteroidota bacterium]
MENGFRLSETVPASPAEIYAAWLSSEGHTAMTGSPAQVDGKVGGIFSAWDGYISGSTLDLDLDRRIVQSWRTAEFPEQAPDSRLEVLLEEAEGGTTVTLIHSALPPGQADSYRLGWEDFYFKPMRAHFNKK